MLVQVEFSMSRLTELGSLLCNITIRVAVFLLTDITKKFSDILSLHMQQQSPEYIDLKHFGGLTA